ncbi:MAG: ATP synthase subunit C [Anaerolineae bacterium]
MYTMLAVLATLLCGALVGLVGLRRSRTPRAAVRAAVGGMLGANGLAVLASAAMAFVVLAQPALAQTTTAADSGGQAALGAALATGLACIGAGIAVGIAGAAAIGGITEKPELLGRTLIFVGLAEGIAIYGLIISFLILTT